MTAFPTDARVGVERVLREALGLRASDVHLEPLTLGYAVKLRVDGLLHTHAELGLEVGRSYVNRLMVMAKLLTYRLDLPQEGGARWTVGPGESADEVDLRVAAMPTHHGMRVVVRLPVQSAGDLRLTSLGLPGPVREALEQFAGADQGMLLVCGPAGSGKTTTIYSLLQEIIERCPGLSVITLEDPVERALPGVTQVQVTPFGELTYEKALRSLLRQDPQVLMLGEVRDAATASIAVQAALSGHRLITTLHAGSPGGAIQRLLEMGLEPYQIIGALHGVVTLRLLRRSDGQGNYHGRIPVATFARMTPAVRASVLRGGGSDLESALNEHAGHDALRSAAEALVAQNLTDQDEVRRVLGDS